MKQGAYFSHPAQSGSQAATLDL